MYLKIMGNENAPDCDSRKTFRVFETSQHVIFQRDHAGTPIVSFRLADEGEDGDLINIDLKANAYLMNENGKTVATFGAGKIPDVDYSKTGAPGHHPE